MYKKDIRALNTEREGLQKKEKGRCALFGGAHIHVPSFCARFDTQIGGQETRVYVCCAL